ncbi:putative FAM18-like protein [Monoraphidium neglectum]|uniref:Golgi apparatus membrane protein TVP23 n=1 Tax=Monoraphidium neglectum TaxID=145388 RepID=A0A0D2N4X7_9CHLO|nr:putative FAM18-like protein [Monoraphidium neglectum]KIZ07377.1 putative FAM18-like protein [Monoraphidium neglectum]|eukprot:XP_013906396.1 putative FAM18-like protein [Monoraphidium neglectum]
MINKNQFVTNFVVCIVLLAMDFWTVKNVTGRLLVGLRWWNDASADQGGTAWRFESLAEGQRAINPHERRWFWIVLVAAPVLWALSALTAFLGLDWVMAVILSLPWKTPQSLAVCTGTHCGCTHVALRITFKR